MLLLVAAGIVWVLWRQFRVGNEGFQTFAERDAYLTGNRGLFHEELTPLGLKKSLSDVGYQGACPDGFKLCGEGNTSCCDDNRRAMFISPGISVDTLQDALQTPDTKPIVKDIRRLFQPLNTSYTELDQGFCRQAVHPRNLRSRAAGESLGCGWWFVEAPTGLSTAALGTPSGPLDTRLGTTYPGGRWIWDLKEAAKAEDLKRCKRIRTCAYIAAENIRGECGFCPEKGHGIPIDSAGNPKYPADAEGLCGSVVSDPTQCPRPTRAAVRNGMDNFVFDDATGMLVTRLVGEEGSDPVSMDRLCDPDADGRLSSACLKGLAVSAGFTERGAFLRRLTGGRGAEADQVTLDVLRAAGFQMPAGLLSDVGSLSLQAAADALGRLSALTMGGTTARIRDAAFYWVVDAEKAIEEWDACPYNADDKGPFPVACLQREFRQAGCQPSGSAFPTTADAATATAGKSMGDLRQEFKALYCRMGSSDPKDQAIAMKACLGIGFQKDPSTLTEMNACKEPGVDVFVYTGLGGNSGSSGSNSDVLVFHTILKSSSLELSLTDKQIINRLIPDGTPIRVVYRTYVAVQDANTTLSIQIPAEGARVRLDGQTLPTTVVGTWSVPVKVGMRHALVLEIPARSATEAVTPQIPFYAENVQVFQLHQASDRPMVSLDFFKSPKNLEAADTNAILPFRTNASRMIYDGVLSIVVNQSEAEGGVGLSLPLVKTVACQFRLLQSMKDATKTYTLLALTNTGGDRFAIEIGGAQIRTIVQTRGSQFVGTVVLDQLLKENTPYHLAVVLDTNIQNIRIFLNGVMLKMLEKDIKKSTLGLDPVLFTRMTVAPDLYSAFGWIHIYDRLLLAQADIDRDRFFNDPAKAGDNQETRASEEKKKMYYPKTAFGNPLYGIDVTSGQYKTGISGKSFEAVETACNKTCQAIVYDASEKTYYGIVLPEAQRLRAKKEDPNVTSWMQMLYNPMYGKQLDGRPLITYKGVQNADVCGDLCQTIRDQYEGPICGGFFFNGLKEGGTCQLFRHVYNGEETRHDDKMTTFVSGIMNYNTLGKDGGYNEKLKRGVLRFATDEPVCRKGYYEYGRPNLRPDTSDEYIINKLEDPIYNKNVKDTERKCCPVRPTRSAKSTTVDNDTCNVQYQTLFVRTPYTKQYELSTPGYDPAKDGLVFSQDNESPDTDEMYTTLDLAVAACEKRGTCAGVFTNTSTGNYYISDGKELRDSDKFGQWIGWKKLAVSSGTGTGTGTGSSLPTTPSLPPASVDIRALNEKLSKLPNYTEQKYDLTFGNDITPAQKWSVF